MDWRAGTGVTSRCLAGGDPRVTIGIFLAPKMPMVTPILEGSQRTIHRKKQWIRERRVNVANVAIQAPPVRTLFLTRQCSGWRALARGQTPSNYYYYYCYLYYDCYYCYY